MIEWLSANKEWMFSGLGVMLLAGIGGILKWLHSRKSAAQPPTVVVRVEHSPPQAIAQAEPPVKLAAPISVERIVSLSPDEIYSAISSTPPMQRDTVAQRFKGLKVEWNTSLLDAREQDGEVTLFLRVRDDVKRDWFNVHCTVRLDEYRELGILPEKSLIRIQGEIGKATTLWVELTNVRLLYMEPAKNA